eukprot:1269322-Karenia_brevis.AAC.1
MQLEGSAVRSVRLIWVCTGAAAQEELMMGDVACTACPRGTCSIQIECIDATHLHPSCTGWGWPIH